MGNIKTTSLDALYAGKEASFGVGVAPTRHIRETGANPNLAQETVQSASHLGTRFKAGPIRVGELGSLSIPFEANVDDLQTFFKLMTGSEVVTGAGPYVHTFTPQNSNVLPSSSFDHIRGGYTRTRLKGGVGGSLSLDIQPKSIVTGTFELNYKTEEEIYKTFDAADIEATGDDITITAHGLANGDMVKLFRDGTATFPANLEGDKVYYVVGSTTDTIQLSLTSGGAVIDLAGSPVGDFILVPQPAITPSTAAIFTYADVSISLDGNNFLEVRGGSIQTNNNSKTDDLRWGEGGVLHGITAGDFGMSGSFSIVFNEDSWKEKAKVKNETETALIIVLNAGSGNKATFTIPKARYSSFSFTDGDLMLDIQWEMIETVPTFALEMAGASVF